MNIIFATLSTAVLFALPAVGQDQQPGPIGTDKGWFHSDCTFNHRAQDDPIVFFRGPGQSHSHDFLGAYVTAGSTNESIRWGPTSCDRTDTPYGTVDRSGYWFPTVYVDDRPVAPVNGTMGYAAGRRDVQSIVPFPDGLRVIAGVAAGGRQEVNGQRVYFWECETQTVAPAVGPGLAPTCDGNLMLTLRFPDCWNGVDLDSRDHRGHMAYSTQGACPRTHPVLVPALQVRLRYPTPGGPSLRLASGDLTTTHGDFMNGWDPDKLAGLVRRCLNADMYCGGSDNPVPGH